MISPELQDIDAARQAHARMPQGKVYRHLWSELDSREIEKNATRRHAESKREAMKKVKK